MDFEKDPDMKRWMGSTPENSMAFQSIFDRPSLKDHFGKLNDFIDIPGADKIHSSFTYQSGNPGDNIQSGHEFKRSVSIHHVAFPGDDSEDHFTSESFATIFDIRPSTDDVPRIPNNSPFARLFPDFLFPEPGSPIDHPTSPSDSVSSPRQPPSSHSSIESDSDVKLVVPEPPQRKLIEAGPQQQPPRSTDSAVKKELPSTKSPSLSERPDSSVPSDRKDTPNPVPPGPTAPQLPQRKDSDLPSSKSPPDFKSPVPSEPSGPRETPSPPKLPVSKDETQVSPPSSAVQPDSRGPASSGPPPVRTPKDKKPKPVTNSRQLESVSGSQYLSEESTEEQHKKHVVPAVQRDKFIIVGRQK